MEYLTVDTDVYACRDVIKKKACILSCLSFDEVRKSQTNCCHGIPTKARLEKLELCNMQV